MAAACAQTADAMRAAGFPLVSVYLEAGDALRCYAVRGYRQLFDGIRPGVGMIGTVWQTGAAVELGGAVSHPVYRRAATEVAAEACVPIVLDGRVVGVLNGESTAALPAGAVDLLGRLAAALAHSLAELGGPPGASTTRALLTHATVLAEAEGAQGTARAFLRAALDTCKMSSAVLLLGAPPRVAASEGPLGAALAGVDLQALALVDGWVGSGGSSRSAEDPQGLTLDGQAALLEAGARGLLLVSVGQGRERVGSLLVADARHVELAPAVVEAVELLSALAAANLRSARATEALRHLAETDHLTGLGHRAGFREALDRALGPPQAEARASSHGAVAVLALDLDGFKQVNDTAGHAAGDEHLRRAAAAMTRALRHGDRLYRVGGDEFATVLLVQDADEAVAVARRVLDGCKRAIDGSASIGVAVAGPGETPEQVLGRADEALYATKRSGRDGVTIAPAPRP